MHVIGEMQQRLKKEEELSQLLKYIVNNQGRSNFGLSLQLWALG
jgi:hypothetical protein